MSLCKGSTIYVPYRILYDSTPPNGMFRTAKFINHPSLMPHLYKDLDDDRLTVVDKRTVSMKSTRHVATGHPQLTPHSYNL